MRICAYVCMYTSVAYAHAGYTVNSKLYNKDIIGTTANCPAHGGVLVYFEVIYVHMSMLGMSLGVEQWCPV